MMEVSNVAINIGILLPSLLLFYLYGDILNIMKLEEFPKETNLGQVIPISNVYELTAAPWPSQFGRAIDGGTGDKFYKEAIHGGSADKLIVRVDGPVVYECSKGEEFGIAFSGHEGERLAYRVPAQHAVLVPIGVAHSLPFKQGNGSGSTDEKPFYSTSRKTNGVVQVAPGEIFTLPVMSTASRKLDADFSKKVLPLQEANDKAAYDVVLFKTIHDERFETKSGVTKDVVTPANWPLVKGHAETSVVEELEQEFTMEWVDEGDHKEILFTGLSGTLEGGSGRPGVVYNKKENSISVNLLLSRPDGSFFIATEENLIMIVAEPTAQGEPKQETMQALRFTNGAKLPAGWWHSVPFPHPEKTKIHLYEKVASTNANTVINVNEETGSPMKLTL